MIRTVEAALDRIDSIRLVIRAMVLPGLILALGACTSISPQRSHVFKGGNEVQVHPDPLCAKMDTETRAAIVFVHGVLGDAASTWGDLDTVDAWPRALSREMPDYAVFVYSYRTKFLEYSSNITEVARQLDEELTLRGAYNCNQLHFVTHSMGGLIVRRLAITLAHRGEEDRLAKIRTMFFLGTPTAGSRLGSLASIFSRNPQFGNLAPADLNAYLQTLDHDWEEVLRARRGRNRGLVPFPLLYCAYETLSTFGIDVVSRSGAKTICDETPLALDANHLDIVKPISDDLVARWVSYRIRDAADRKALTNPRIIVMDSAYADNIYNEATCRRGATNADDIIPILRSAHPELVLSKELVYPQWEDIRRTVATNPALLIIHLSAFGREDASWRDRSAGGGLCGNALPTTDDQVCRTGWSSSERYRLFRSFVETVLNQRPEVKILVYTRASSCVPPLVGHEAFNKEYESFKESFRRYGENVVWFELPHRDFGNAELNKRLSRTFDDPESRRNFVECTDFALGLLEKPGKNCSSMGSGQ